MIMPIALGYLLFSGHVQPAGAESGGTWLLLFLAGVFTALPLLLFAEGAKRLPLYQVGILQYIAPTITLLIGLFVYHEPFSRLEGFYIQLYMGCADLVYVFTSEVETGVKKPLRPLAFQLMHILCIIISCM